jgi:type II secretory pathway pseudopilin PulG
MRLRACDNINESFARSATGPDARRAEVSVSKEDTWRKHNEAAGLVPSEPEGTRRFLPHTSLLVVADDRFLHRLLLAPRLRQKSPASKGSFISLQAPKRAVGFALVELAVGLCVLMVALGIGLQAIALSTEANREYARRSAAREAVQLALERVRAEGMNLPAPGQTLQTGVPVELAQRLPGAACAVSVQADSEIPVLVRVRVSVTWKGGATPETGEATIAKRGVPPEATR